MKPLLRIETTTLDDDSTTLTVEFDESRPLDFSEKLGLLEWAKAIVIETQKIENAGGE